MCLFYVSEQDNSGTLYDIAILYDFSAYKKLHSNT